MARVSYLLIQTFKEKQNDQKRLSGTFQVLDGNILMLVHPSSGDNIFYKVREDKSVILLDSFGNGPKVKVLYSEEDIIKRIRSMCVVKRVVSNFV